MAKEIKPRLTKKGFYSSVRIFYMNHIIIWIIGMPIVSPASSQIMRFHSWLLLTLCFTSCHISHSSIGFWAVTQGSWERYRLAFRKKSRLVATLISYTPPTITRRNQFFLILSTVIHQVSLTTFLKYKIGKRS